MGFLVSVLLASTAFFAFSSDVCTVRDPSITPVVPNVNGWQMSITVAGTPVTQIQSGDWVNIGISCRPGNSFTAAIVTVSDSTGPQSNKYSWDFKSLWAIACSGAAINAADQTAAHAAGSIATLSWGSSRDYLGTVTIAVALQLASGWIVLSSPLTVVAALAPPECSVRVAPQQLGLVGKFFDFDVSKYCRDPQGSSLTYDVSGISRSTNLSFTDSHLTGTLNLADWLLPQPLSLAITITNIVGLQITLEVDLNISGTPPLLSPNSTINCSIAGYNEPYKCKLASYFNNYKAMTFSMSADRDIGFQLRGNVIGGVITDTGLCELTLTYDDGVAQGTTVLVVNIVDNPFPDMTATLGKKFRFDVKPYFFLGLDTSTKIFWFLGDSDELNSFTISRTLGTFDNFPLFFDKGSSPIRLSVQMQYGVDRGIKYLTINIEGDDTAPIDLGLPSVITFIRGVNNSFDFSKLVKSPGGFPMEFSVGTLLNGTALNTSTRGIFFGIPNSIDDSGAPYDLALTVSDNIGNSASFPISLTIQSGNTGAALVPGADLSLLATPLDPTQDVYVSFSPFIEHPLGYDMSYRVVGMPSGSGLVTVSGDTLTGTPTKADYRRRVELLTLIVTDDRNVAVSFPFKLVFAPANITFSTDNFAGLWNLTVNSDFRIDLTNLFTDSMGETLTFTVDGLPRNSGIVLAGDGLAIEGNPNSQDLSASPLTLTVTALEECCSFVNVSVQVTVTINVDTNPPPTQNGIPLYIARENQNISFDLNPYFSNSVPNMRFNYSTLSRDQGGFPEGSGLRISPDGILYGPASQTDFLEAQLGNYQANFTVYPMDLTKSIAGVVNLNILEKYVPYMVSPLPVATTYEGLSFVNNISSFFTIEGNGALRYRFQALANNPPDGSGISITKDGCIQGTPTGVAQKASPLSLQVQVLDEFDSSFTTTLYLTVLPPYPVPQLVGRVRDINATVGTPFSVNLAPYFQDSSGSALSYTLSGVPAGCSVTLDPTTGVLSGTVANMGPSWTLMAVAKNAYKSSLAQSFLVTPKDDKAGPQPVGLIPTISAVQGKPIASTDLSSYFSDQLSMVFSLGGADQAIGLAVSPDGTLSGTPQYYTSSPQLLLLAKDSSGLTANRSIPFVILVRHLESRYKHV